MSRPTRHGEAIANDIQGEDAYGHSGHLTLADVWLILDNIHSDFVEKDDEEPICSMLSKFMDEIERLDPEMTI
jgi:hypothetical protein